MVIRELTLEVLESPRRRSHHEALGFVGGEPLATLIEVEGSDVRIAGTVEEYASERPTAVAQTKAAVWRARLER